jgi:pteridine reductase
VYDLSADGYPHEARSVNERFEVECMKGRLAIVTGGGVRLGRAIALGIARAGGDVCIHCSSSLKAAQEVASEVKAMGRRVMVVQADLRAPELAATTIMNATVDQMGLPDFLINNAGVLGPSVLEDVDAESWNELNAINVQAPFFLARAFHDAMGEDRSGSIVNIADWRQEAVSRLPYVASKTALVAMTRSLAVALAPRIRVNAIGPGAILPPPGSDDLWEEAFAGRIPLERTGSVDDVVDAVLFLLRAPFITGELINVTGGQQLNTGGICE